MPIIPRSLTLFLCFSIIPLALTTSSTRSSLPAVFAVLPRPTFPQEHVLGTEVKAELKPLGDGPATYTAAVTPPRGCAVRVEPAALEFSSEDSHLGYRVVFFPQYPAGREAVTAGKITWSQHGKPDSVVTVPVLVRWI